MLFGDTIHSPFPSVHVTIEQGTLTRSNTAREGGGLLLAGTTVIDRSLIAFNPPPVEPIKIAGNLVAGNAGAGVDLIGVDRVRVHGNDIGESADGGVPLGNGGSGVRISSGSDNWVGGLAEGEGNLLGDGASGMLTATATDPGGNTSEFSACLEGPLAEPIYADGFEPNVQ